MPLRCIKTVCCVQAAVFPPQFRNLADPQLELFDLDEAFSSEKARLAQLTNKCGEEDLEYYIRSGFSLHRLCGRELRFWNPCFIPSWLYISAFASYLLILQCNYLVSYSMYVLH
jgi:hypothetical protein